jgi:hypothetical protein
MTCIQEWTIPRHRTKTKKTIKYNTETTRTSPKPEVNPGAREVWAVPTSYKTFAILLK